MITKIGHILCYFLVFILKILFATPIILASFASTPDRFFAVVMKMIPIRPP